MKKIILIIALILISVSLFGCQKISAYQKSIFDDDTKIVKEADSYFFQKKVGNHTKTKTDFDYEKFTGKFTLYNLNVNADTAYEFDYDITINGGRLKLVFVNPDDKVEIITDKTAKGKASINLKDGRNRIILIGDESGGSILLTMTESDGVNIST